MPLIPGTPILLVLIGLGGMANAAPHAHTHGQGQAQLSLTQQTLSIELTLPAEVAVGFERAPRTEAERLRLSEALGRLAQTDQIWTLPPAAGCKAQAAKVQSPQWGASDHADVVATYAWQCDKPQALDRLQTQLFEVFKRLRRLDLMHVTSKSQGSARLTPKKPQLNLEPAQ